MSTEHNAEHNRAFEQLVSGDEDLIGFIAYALYKKDKRDFVLGWMEMHNAPPQAEQVRAFTTTVLTLGQQLRFRTAARDMLDAYAKTVADAEKPLIEKGAVTERFEHAAKRVEHSIRWYRQIPAGIVAGLVMGGILALAVFAMAQADLQPWARLTQAPATSATAETVAP